MCLVLLFVFFLCTFSSKVGFCREKATKISFPCTSLFRGPRDMVKCSPRKHKDLSATSGIHRKGQAWWRMPIIPEMRRWSQEDVWGPIPACPDAGTH